MSYQTVPTTAAATASTPGRWVRLAVLVSLVLFPGLFLVILFLRWGYYRSLHIASRGARVKGVVT